MRLRWHELIRALEHRGHGQYGVDPVSGQVRFFDLHELESDDPLELLEEDTYVMIEPVPEGVVGEWVEELADLLGRADLAAAAESPNPLKEVRRRLAGEPGAQETWDRLYRRRLERMAEAWVRGQELSPENPPPWPVTEASEEDAASDEPDARS